MNQQRRTPGRIEGLDLLRGLAIAFVLARHGWPQFSNQAGMVGVVVFFALSGYLITGILLNDITRVGRVRYGHFYRNRILRLYPALVLTVSVFAGVETIFDILGNRDVIIPTMAVAFTYTMNIPPLYGHSSQAMHHLWTLATEEQFYLVWPLLLTIGVRMRRLGTVLALSALASVAVCVVILVDFPKKIPDPYTLPTSWALVMIIGAAARVYQDRLASVLPAGRVGAGLSLAAFSGIVVLAGLPEHRTSLTTFVAMAPAVGLLTVILIFHMRQWAVIPTPALRPILALGTISYAAYLWNYPIVLWVGSAESMTITQSVTSIVLTIAAASVSWWIVERPCQRLKRRLDRNSGEKQASPVITI